MASHILALTGSDLPTTNLDLLVSCVMLANDSQSVIFESKIFVRGFDSINDAHFEKVVEAIYAWHTR